MPELFLRRYVWLDPPHSFLVAERSGLTENIQGIPRYWILTRREGISKLDFESIQNLFIILKIENRIFHFFFKTVSTGRALFIFYEERRNFILDCIGQNLENFHLLYRGHRRRTRTSSFGFTTSLIARRCPPTPSRQESIIVEETGIGTLVNYRVTVIQFARIPSATFFASTRFPRCARHESRSI